MKHLTILLTTLLFLLASCSKRTEGKDLYTPTDSTDHNPVPHGIDVSHHNDLDWSQIKRFEQLQFMYAKATEGATFQDDKFEEHRQFAKDHNLKFGGYHFLTTTSPVAEQFDNFKSVAGRCDCLPMLDIEGWRIQQLDTLDLQNLVDEWISCCQKEWNVKPIIYCSAKLHGKLNMRGCPWWVDAETCRNKNNVHTAEPQGDYAIWQFSVYRDTTVARTYRPDGKAVGDSVDVNFLRPGTSIKFMLMPPENTNSK